MQLLYLLLLSLVTLASANTLPNSYSTQAVKCNNYRYAGYDDLPTQPPASVPIPIAPNRGLKYNNLVLLTLGYNPPAGIKPASIPNVIGFGVVTAGSTASVTVIGGTPYSVFRPAGIAYACAVEAVETAVSVPISCTLAFSGYRAGALVRSKIANYEVAIGEVNKAMSTVSLFAGLDQRPIDTLTFELVTPTQLGVAARFDNFQYYLCK